MDDQTIRLILQQAGWEGLPKSKADIDALKAALDAMVPSLSREETASVEAATATRTLSTATYELGDVYELVEQKQAQHVAKVRTNSEAMREASMTSALTVGAAMEQTSTRLSSVEAAAGRAGRGVGGILNNLEGIAMALGGGPGLAGILTIAGVAAFIFKDKIKDAMDALGESKSPVKEAVGSLEGFERQVKKNHEEIDKLRDAEKLSYDEQRRFNVLIAETTDLESKLTAEKKRRAEIEALGALQSKDQRERASAFKEAMAETGPEKAAAQLRQALTNIGDQSGQDYTAEGIANQADDLMVRASHGDKEARDQIMRAVGGFMPEGQRGFAKTIDALSPETKAATKAAHTADEEEFNEGKKADKATADARTQADKTLPKALKFRADMDAQVETDRRTDAMEQIIIDTFGSTDKFMSYKKDQAAAGKAKHTADQAAQHQQNAMAQNITRETGGDVRGDAAQAAAERAIQYIQRGANVQQAMQQSVFDLMHGFISDQAAMLALYERNAANVGHLANMHAQNSARLRTNLPRN